jgi:hypothetical protein
MFVRATDYKTLDVSGCSFEFIRASIVVAAFVRLDRYSPI